MKVIFGGGRAKLGAHIKDDAKDRNDSRNLVSEWLNDKALRRVSAKYVTNNQEFQLLDVNDADFILGNYWVI